MTFEKFCVFLHGDVIVNFLVVFLEVGDNGN